MQKIFLINSLLPSSTYRNLAVSMSLTHGLIPHRVSIKHVTINKCDLFFHNHNAKEISFCHFHYTKLSGKHETHVNSIYIVGIMFIR